MTEQITSIYTPNPYERLEPKETATEVREAAEVLKELVESDHELKQAILNEAVDSITAINETDIESTEKRKYVKSILEVVKPFFEDENGPGWAREIGILGEVATNLALKELRFDLVEPTSDDDTYGAIDIIADPREPDGTIFAIQVKTHRSLEGPLVEVVVEQESTLPNTDSFLTENQYRDSDETAMKMLNYITQGDFTKEHPKLSDRPVTPLIVRVPGGGRDTVAYFKSYGEPALQYPDKLYDKIADAVGWKE